MRTELKKERRKLTKPVKANLATTSEQATSTQLTRTPTTSQNPRSVIPLTTQINAFKMKAIGLGLPEEDFDKFIQTMHASE